MEKLKANEDPYTPPKADLETVSGESSTFYVVSIRKFSVLFLSTLGIYIVYWFYANWKGYREATGERIWPVPRAIFNIFFTHSLFAKVDSVLKQRGEPFQWAPAAAATLYVVISILSNVLDRVSIKGIGSPFTDILSILSVPLLCYVLLQPQRAINISAGDAGGSSNSSFDAFNYIWIVLGLALWFLVFVGLLETFGTVGSTLAY